MRLSESLKLKKGVVAVIGGSGKAEFIQALMDELAPRSRVALCSPYTIPLPIGAAVVSSSSADAVSAALDQGRPAAIGIASDGLLLPIYTDVASLKGSADYVLCVADHCAGLPLIAHSDENIRLPEHADMIIEVVGLAGLCRPVSIAAYDPARFAALGGISESDFITPEAAARVINAEALHDCLFIDQADSREWYAEAVLLAERIYSRCVIGSLRNRDYHVFK